MSTTKTFGYDRRAAVPKLADTTPKLCKTCSAWFAARKREQRCDDCLPPTEKRRRFARAHYAELAESDAQRGAQRRSGLSEPGKVTTPRRHVSRTNGQVTSAVSDGGVMCRELALELAEKVDYPNGAPQPMSRAYRHQITLWNVNHGKQGRCDL